MSASAFSRNSFQRTLKAGDSQRFGIDLKIHKNEQIDEAIATIADLDPLKSYNETYLGGKRHISYSHYPTVLLLRALANNLKYVLKVKLPNRMSIVEGVQQTIQDATPMVIHRRDVTSFYESIPIEPIRATLLRSAIISPTARHVLSTFLDIHCGEIGVPRGSPLSAILAEIGMIAIDQRIRRRAEIYRYFRFSDDLLIFSFDKFFELDPFLESIFPSSFQLNQAKHFSRATDLHGSQGSPLHFEYLGYDFYLAAGGVPKGEPRPVSITIANSKVRKIKTRLALAAKRLQIEDDARLFVDRVLFLSGNYTIYRSKINVKAPRKKVRSGIFFNYPHCALGSGLASLPTNEERLQELDSFFRSAFLRQKGRFWSILSSRLSASQMQQVRRISFSSGYRKAMMRRFSAGRIRQIKAAWNYAG